MQQTFASQDKAATLKTSATVKVMAVVFWVLLTALSAQAKIYLPFTPVPITLQTGVVIMGGLLLGTYGVLAQLLYVLLGGIGLPLFAVNLPGVNAVWGPTGGYLLGFMLTSYLTAKFVRPTFASTGFFKTSSRLFLISMAIFVPGVFFLMLSTGSTFAQALQMGFYPFVLGEAIKVVLVSTTPKNIFKKVQVFS